MVDDTIAAIATPIGQGGLAVVRISGRDALTIADRVFKPAGTDSSKPSAAPTHTIHFGHVVRQGKTIDEVLAMVMRAPRTFTREDTVEITCHGGVLPASLVLETLLDSGARVAEPGEFTRRAFLNGRIDLTQAEAVADLIHSRTELALHAANEQLAGKLSQRINQLRDDLLETLAHVEAHIDFPDEDIAPDAMEKLVARLEQGMSFIDELLRTAKEGQILRRGIRAAIIGKPNAGKSSLLNQLLGHDRAIVSSIPGTTRDTIEETADIRGLPVILVDTAGLRESQDEIEVEGVRRSRQSLERAELILHVVDVTRAAEPEPQYIAEADSRKRIIVLNKVDLLPTGAVLPAEDFPAKVAESAPVVQVSCVTGAGIESLKNAIKGLIWSGGVGTEMFQVMINSRHQQALIRAREATVKTLEAFRCGETLEVIAMELRIAVNAIGEIVGKTTTEDLLDTIFSRFCIGK